ncbi:MAG: organic hydroperoxide resistance protein [Blastocatellia bacterium]|nr:organic hydroperoxide resistance protein [Blastocatellia bacterium]
MSIKVLYTAHATSTGGRNGHVESSDGVLKIDLSVPKSMGGLGKDGTTTPEDLFAAGYAACFGSACEFMSRQLKLKLTSIEVKAAVGLGQNESGGFGLTVDLDVKTAGLSQSEAEQLVAAGHSICPYSLAVKGNVDVNIKTTAV